MDGFLKSNDKIAQPDKSDPWPAGSQLNALLAFIPEEFRYTPQIYHKREQMHQHTRTCPSEFI